MTKILVTTYINPDIDGSTSMYAYSELLRLQGRDGVAGYFGTPLPDAKFAFDHFEVRFPEPVSQLIYDKVVLVDVSDLQRIKGTVDPEDVIEIIDHHEPNLENFPNATAQIEHIGAAATMIVERFQKSGFEPSFDIAKLIQLAIVHGTLNFKTPNTTDKDREMYKWLSGIVQIEQTDIDALFEVMTTIDKPLIDFVRNDFKDKKAGSKKFGIASFPVFGIDKFLDERKAELLEVLEQIKKEKNLDYIWFGSVDLSDGSSYLLTPDEKTSEFLQEALGIDFSDNEARLPEIILRKQHIREVFQYLSKESV